MRPTEKDSDRVATLRLHLRSSFGRGTELQLLCAMPGLPVLPSSGNNYLRMRQYLLAAVRFYAQRNPTILDGEPSRVWWPWEGDTVELVPRAEAQSACVMSNVCARVSVNE